MVSVENYEAFKSKHAYDLIKHFIIVFYSLQIVLKVAVIGGTLDAKKIKPFNSSYRPEELKIAVLLWNGSVYLCKKNKPESETRFIR